MKAFSIKNPDQPMIMQPDPKRKILKELDKCLFHMYGAQTSSKNKLFQYPSKNVTETADAKIKIGATKTDGKEILLVIAEVNLVAKKFQRYEYCHKNQTRVPSRSDYSTSNTSMEDFTPGLNSARHY